MYLSVVLSGFSELQIKLYINDEQAATFFFFFFYFVFFLIATG